MPNHMRPPFPRPSQIDFQYSFVSQATPSGAGPAPQTWTPDAETPSTPQSPMDLMDTV